MIGVWMVWIDEAAVGVGDTPHDALRSAIAWLLEAVEMSPAMSRDEVLECLSASVMLRVEIPATADREDLLRSFQRAA